ncbi:Hypothetical protein PBC10988_32150 [Planctomycetales bacterium 10988]|nr:Hypothetical protein PBC10988_32150 [Planctomycetales bacterium 10988]
MTGTTGIRSLSCALFVGCVVGGWQVTSSLQAAEITFAIQPQVEQLEKKLAGSDHESGWKSYLMWPKFQPAVQTISSSNDHPAVIDQVRMRLRCDDTSAQWRPVKVLRESLDRWSYSAPVLSQPELFAAINELNEVSYPGFDTDKIEAARVKALQELEKLERFYSYQKYGEGWISYLRLDELKAKLQALKDTPPTPADYELIDDIFRQFISGETGLELDRVVALQEALKEYTFWLKLQSTEDPEATLQSQLANLRENLSKYAENPTQELAESLGESVFWLDRLEISPRIVRSIRHHFAQPNISIHVEESLAKQAVEEPVNRVSPVREIILGTRVSGTGHTRGLLTLDFTPNNNAASFQFLLTGRTHSDTVGRNGPATIYSSSLTKFFVYRPVTLTPDHLLKGEICGDADTDTRTKCVTTNIGFPFRKIAQRIATKQVAEKKPAAERESARKALAKVESQFQDDLDEALSEAEADFESKLVTVLERRGIDPAETLLSTTDTSMLMRVVNADPNQLAATSLPPGVSKRSQIVARIHESAINNLSHRYSGAMVDQNSSRARIEELFGEVPEAWEEGEDRPEEGQLFFAENRPITASFQDGTLKIILRAEKIISPKRSFTAHDIVATYNLEKTQDGFQFKREGRLLIAPPDFDYENRKLPLRLSIRADLLRKYFDRIFEETFELDPFVPEGDMAKLGPLMVEDVKVHKGWIAIGYRQQ